MCNRSVRGKSNASLDWVAVLAFAELEAQTPITATLSVQVMYVGDLVGFYVIPMFLNIVIYAKIAIVLSQCGEKMKGKESSKPFAAYAPHCF